MGATKDKKSSAAGELRSQAEERLREKKEQSRLPGSEKDAQRLVHELEVHQIELEMQNAELRQTQEDLELSHAKYLDLYDFAPVGYCTLDAEGRIREINLTGCQLLGMERRKLANKPFGVFIADADGKQIFSRHLADVLQNQGNAACEILLKRNNGISFWGRLQITAKAQSGGQPGSIYTTIIDISERKQAEDALQKSHDDLEQTIYERTVELRTALSEIHTMKDQLEAENLYFRHEIKMKQQFDNIVGNSDGLQYVLYRAKQVAQVNTTVLILGESGTGKELIAAAIHELSPRRERPLIMVNCAALPANLIESELFGREKGAFTGADARRMGRFEIANGSTICLDEIGELPLELQIKLLRVIQHHEFERLGSSNTIKVDVRILATTNRDLDKEVREGRFREDLFYRINVFPITVPPLRQRQEDIPLIAQAFVERFSKKMGKQITMISKETMQALQDYPWPGNVRELESIIERAVILCQGTVLHLADKLDTSSPAMSSALRTLEEMERSQILKILSETRWRIEGKDGAASILGLHASTLRARMHKLGIVRPQARRGLKLKT